VRGRGKGEGGLHRLDRVCVHHASATHRPIHPLTHPPIHPTQSYAGKYVPSAAHFMLQAHATAHGYAEKLNRRRT
jgi:hypothetical protein